MMFGHCSFFFCPVLTSACLFSCLYSFKVRCKYACAVYNFRRQRDASRSIILLFMLSLFVVGFRLSDILLFFLRTIKLSLSFFFSNTLLSTVYCYYYYYYYYLCVCVCISLFFYFCISCSENGVVKPVSSLFLLRLSCFDLSFHSDV
jgi:hypothetical protein